MVPMRTRCPGSSRNAVTSSSRMRGTVDSLKEVPVRIARSHLLDGLLQEYPPRAHHIDAIDDAQRLADVLLEQQHGQPLGVGQVPDAIEDLLHDGGCEAE